MITVVPFALQWIYGFFVAWHKSDIWQSLKHSPGLAEAAYALIPAWHKSDS